MFVTGPVSKRQQVCLTKVLLVRRWLNFSDYYPFAYTTCPTHSVQNRCILPGAPPHLPATLYYWITVFNWVKTSTNCSFIVVTLQQEFALGQVFVLCVLPLEIIVTQANWTVFALWWCVLPLQAFCPLTRFFAGFWHASGQFVLEALCPVGLLHVDFRQASRASLILISCPQASCCYSPHSWYLQPCYCFRSCPAVTSTYRD